MPELPEVETVRLGLLPALEGKRILRVEQRRPDLRFPLPERFAARLEGQGVTALTRRAKYLVAGLDGGEALVMHLGMTGSFRVGGHMPGAFQHPRSKDAAHDHVVFHLEGGAHVTYNDPRRFGFMLLVARAALPEHPLFRHLGIEPLGNELSGETLARLFAGKTTPLKAALLDQTLIAGLGNIYACEALNRARLSPRRAAGTLAAKRGGPTPRATRMAFVIGEVLREALAAGGSTLNDFAHADGAMGYFQHRFRAYGRQGLPCLNEGCGGAIARIVQSGRSTFFCGQCQR